jgi:DNA-directed RNA polymerase subunit RPC12/RpoP
MAANKHLTPPKTDDGKASSPPGAGRRIIVCPRCRATLPDRSINHQQRRAVCPACEHRFAIDDQRVSAPRVSRGRRKNIAPPFGMTSKPSPDGLTLAWRWPRWRSTAPLIFLVLFGGLFVFYAVIRSTAGTPELRLVLSIFAVACLSLLWLFLAYRLNSTTIVIRDGHLRIRHGPVPWPGRRDLPVDSIRQVYSQMYHEHALRRGDGYTSYRVRVLRVDGTELLLVNDLPRQEQALYLEQEIERYLRIDDELVRGELPR